MPDKYVTYFIEMGFVKLILEDLNAYARANTVCALLKILTFLATHQDCRAYILRYNGYDRALEFTEDSNDMIKFEALQLLANLS